MNELINVRNQNGELLVSARELHKGLGIGTKYNDWFKRMTAYGFEENLDYILVTQKKVTNNIKNPYTTYTDHILKLDCAKEICMIQRNEKGKMFRKYFIECEKKLREIKPTISKRDELLLQLFSSNPTEVANAHKQLVEIEVNEATKPLIEKIDKDKPLVKFADRVLKDGDNILVRDLAKIATEEGYKIGEKRLYNKLRDWKYICKKSTQPTQNAMESDYFIVETKVINTPYGSKQVFTTKVTPKGQIRIVERLLNEGE